LHSVSSPKHVALSSIFGCYGEEIMSKVPTGGLVKLKRRRRGLPASTHEISAVRRTSATRPATAGHPNIASGS
jgi:hypothetical protein